LVRGAVTGASGRRLIPRAVAYAAHLRVRANRAPAVVWLRRQAFDHGRPRRRPHLIALGDSHVQVVLDAARRPELRAAVSLCSVYGATAQGLMNPNSATDAVAVFDHRLRRVPEWQTLVFLLGEVDCGFVIWHRAEKHGVSVESQLIRSLTAYGGLLERNAGRHRTLVLSAPLPTIRDGQDWGTIANLRRDVRASQRSRTELTLEYNSRLEVLCREVGARFLDVTTATLDPGTGLIATEFNHPDPMEHHLHPQRYAELVAAVLGDELRP
jgi:hypothetical protein